MLPIAILATLVWVSASLAWAWQPRHVPAAEASKLAAPAPCAATMAANGTSAVADGARLELPQAAKPGTRMRTPSGVEMVWIPAGEFSIGSSPEDRARILRLADRKVPIMPDDVNDEGFGIRITLKLGFWMARYEVTQSQWKAVMGNNPSYWQGARNRLANDEAMPVERVSYEDVQAFLRRLNERNDGYIYRLPSEAEWEYACRAGTTTDYAGPLDEMSWYANNSGEKYLDVYAIYAAKAERYFNPQQLWQQHLQPNGNQPHPVGARPPNAWGLYDMHGNVWEWVAGTETVLGYVEPFPRDGSSNLLEPERAGRVRFYAVIRGGAYHNAAWQCRSAERDNTLTIDRFNTIGFRVVAVPRQ
jgi:formylglycine-generating enzyme required for sulfatase activity